MVHVRKPTSVIAALAVAACCNSLGVSAFVTRPLHAVEVSCHGSVCISAMPSMAASPMGADEASTISISTSSGSSSNYASAFAPLKTSQMTTTSLSSSMEATSEFAYRSPPAVGEYDLSESLIGAMNKQKEQFGTMSGMNLQDPSVGFARVLILGASAVYGTNFAIVKLLDEQMPFAVSAAMRFCLAAGVVSALVMHGERRSDTDVIQEAGADQTVIPQLLQQSEDRKAATFAGIEIGSWYCLGYLCQSIGLQTADASKSAFFNALAVIVVPLLDSAFRGKQMGTKEISSVGLAIAGVGLLQLGPSLASGVPMSVSNGDLFCLGQALLFGIGYWRLEAISGQHVNQAGRITAGQLTGVALGSTLFCGLTCDMPSMDQLQAWATDPFTVGALAWTALVSTALALYLETVALKAVSAAELTVLMTSVSLFGSGFAYVTMGETMSPIGMAGGLMILAGCVFSSLGGSNEVKLVDAPAAALPVTTMTEDAPDVSTTLPTVPSIS